MMPNCRREFITDFLRDNFTQTFLNNTLRTRQAGILVDISANYIPHTQQIINIRETVGQLHKTIRDYEADIAAIQNKISEKRGEITHYERNIRTIMRGGKETTAYKFTQKCPTDECAGYLTNCPCDTPLAPNVIAKYCSLCKKYTCDECNATITETGTSAEPTTHIQHKCDPDTRRTLAEIRRHAKPCPKCGVFISKTEGCNDMFCNLCNTAFRYDTGAIQTHNSNPMYAAYVRHMAAAATVVPTLNTTGCVEINVYLDTVILSRLRELIDYNSNNTSDQIKTKVKYLANAVGNVVQCLLHCETQLHDKYQYYNRLEELYNTELAYMSRLSWLNKYIDDAHYHNELYKLCKENDKKRDYAHAFELYCQSLRDILTEFYNHVMGVPVATSSLDEVVKWGFHRRVRELTEYVNDCFKQIGAKYKTQAAAWISMVQMHTFVGRYVPHGERSHCEAFLFKPTLHEGAAHISRTQRELAEFKNKLLKGGSFVAVMKACDKYVFDDVPLA